MSAALATTPQPAINAPEPGSFPLRNPAYEWYTREIALMATPIQAVRKVAQDHPEHAAVIKAGFATMTQANAAKLDRKRKIRDRVAWFAREAEETLRMKRRELEGYLWGALRNDPAKYFEVITTDITDKEGEVIGTKEVERFRFLNTIPAELRQYVEVTDKGLKLVQKSEVHKELRKMLGLDAPTRAEVNTRDLTLEALVMLSLAKTEEPEQPKIIEEKAA